MISYKDVPGHFNFEDIYIDAVDKAPEGSTLVEIGSYLGKSAVFMADRIKKSGKELNFYVVDNWSDEYFKHSAMFNELGYDKPAFEVFKDHVRAAGFEDAINVIQEPSPQAARHFEKVFFVFIDGDHSHEAVKKDIRVWKSKLVKHGILAGHDYERGKVRNAVRELLSPHAQCHMSWIHYPDSKFHVLSEEATLQHALKNETNLIRIGTGEIKYLLGRGHKYNTKKEHRVPITNTFREALGHSGIFDNKNKRRGNRAFMTCIPRLWEPFEIYADEWHQRFLSKYKSEFKKIESYLNANVLYGSNFFSRLESAPQNPSFWETAKSLWEGRRVIAVTGEHLSLTEFGDLFSGANIVREIKVPPMNAYNAFDSVLSELKRCSKENLILCSCGFLATCLCYDLSRKGYQALDVGRIGRGYLTPTLEGYKGHHKMWNGIKAAS